MSMLMVMMMVLNIKIGVDDDEDGEDDNNVGTVLNDHAFNEEDEDKYEYFSKSRVHSNLAL